MLASSIRPLDSAAKLAITAAIMGVLSGTPVSAAKRCDWHGPKATGENTYKKCFDYAGQNGKTIPLPSNTTRISRDGISFCENAINPGGSLDADIVYMMDNSGSMEDGDDVNGVRSAPGDPHGIRDKVIRRAIRQQRASTNITTAGFLSFKGINANENHNNILWTEERAKQQRPLDISRASDPQGEANMNTLLRKVWKHDPAEALLPKRAAVQKIALTYWSEAFTLARSWFSADSGFVRTKNHAIILISDGAISDWNQAQAMAATLPPVYGIHLGDTADADHLRSLTQLTNGKMFYVSPNDTNTFYQVMQNIVGIITKNPLPKGVTVSNSTYQPPQVSQSTGMTVNPDGSMGMVLDSILGLKPGKNEISIEVTRDDNTKAQFSFTLDVSGDAQDRNTPNLTCYEMPTLAVSDASGPVTIYSQTAGSYTVELKRSPSELEGVTVVATTATGGGDRENINMPAGSTTLGFPIQTANVKVNPADGDPSGGNGTIEVANKDDIKLTWTHPRDERETVILLLPGRQLIVIDGTAKVKIDTAIVIGRETNRPPNPSNPAVVVDKAGTCVVNCGGSPSWINDPKGIPTWEIAIRAPLKYRLIVYDHFGQFVNSASGEMTPTQFDQLPKDGDSAVVRLMIPPFARNGIQLGTGAYLVRMELLGTDPIRGTNSAGDPTIIKSKKNKEYFRRFGYVRN